MCETREILPGWDCETVLLFNLNPQKQSSMSNQQNQSIMQQNQNQSVMNARVGKSYIADSSLTASVSEDHESNFNNAKLAFTILDGKDDFIVKENKIYSPYGNIELYHNGQFIIMRNPYTGETRRVALCKIAMRRKQRQLAKKIKTMLGLR
jgi:hypothetical protein